MMGKYDKFIVKEDEGNLTFFTKMIANEIAESNRLKRIELDLKITELNTQWNHSNMMTRTNSSS